MMTFRNSRARSRWVVGIALVGLLLAPATVSAAAVPAKAIASISLTNATECTFDFDYKWSGFGGAGMSAYGIVALYLREPNATDVLVTFSQQSDSPVASPKSGEVLWRYIGGYGGLNSWHPSADAVLVAKGALIAEKAHYGTIEIPEARAESTPIAIPAFCLTI